MWDTTALGHVCIFIQDMSCKCGRTLYFNAIYLPLCCARSESMGFYETLIIKAEFWWTAGGEHSTHTEQLRSHSRIKSCVIWSEISLWGRTHTHTHSAVEMCYFVFFQSKRERKNSNTAHRLCWWCFTFNTSQFTACLWLLSNTTCRIILELNWCAVTGSTFTHEYWKKSFILWCLFIQQKVWLLMCYSTSCEGVSARTLLYFFWIIAGVCHLSERRLAGGVMS